MMAIDDCYENVWLWCLGGWTGHTPPAIVRGEARGEGGQCDVGEGGEGQAPSVQSVEPGYGPKINSNVPAASPSYRSSCVIQGLHKHNNRSVIGGRALGLLPLDWLPVATTKGGPTWTGVDAFSSSRTRGWVDDNATRRSSHLGQVVRTFGEGGQATDGVWREVGERWE